MRPCHRPRRADRLFWPGPVLDTSRREHRVVGVAIGHDRAVKHASTETLDRLEPMLVKLRRLPALRERSRGVFYIRSRAFLHFHEDPSGLFADVRLILDEDFVRIRVSSGPERARLLKAIEKTCAERD